MKKTIKQREILVALMKGFTPLELARLHHRDGWSEFEIMALKEEAKANGEWIKIMTEEAKKR